MVCEAATPTSIPNRNFKMKSLVVAHVTWSLYLSATVINLGIECFRNEICLLPSPSVSQVAYMHIKSENSTNAQINGAQIQRWHKSIVINYTDHHLTTGFLLVRVLVSSILDLCIWKEGTTHCPQEHCSPAQLNEPRRALHLGQRICGSKIKRMCA